MVTVLKWFEKFWPQELQHQNDGWSLGGGMVLIFQHLVPRKYYVCPLNVAHPGKSYLLHGLLFMIQHGGVNTFVFSGHQWDIHKCNKSSWDSLEILTGDLSVTSWPRLFLLKKKRKVLAISGKSGGPLYYNVTMVFLFVLFRFDVRSIAVVWLFIINTDYFLFI